MEVIQVIIYKKDLKKLIEVYNKKNKLKGMKRMSIRKLSGLIGVSYGHLDRCVNCKDKRLSWELWEKIIKIIC